jgi:hypothetical protein
MNRPEIGKRAELITPPGLTGEEAEAFKRSMAAYQQCTRDKAAEIRLADSARNVIDLRDKQPFWESALKSNTTLRSQYPGGYAQMLKDGFASYRAFGGTAASIDAVRPLPSPCTNPWESYKGPQAPLTDTRQMKVAP